MRKNIFMMLAVFLSAFVFSTTALAQQKFTVSLNGDQENPPVFNTGRGECIVTLNLAETEISVNCIYSGVSSNVTMGHIHNNGPVGVNGPVLFNFNYTGGQSGTVGPLTFTVNATQVAEMKAKRWYVNLHTVNNPGGELRGQVKTSRTAFDFDGDGRTDIAVFRQSANTIYTLNSKLNNISATVFGSGTGDNWLTSHPSDFDGDGRGDPLLLKLNQTSGDAYWSVLRTASNSINTTVFGNFATANVERLVTSDYDGDAKQDIAVFRAGTGVWYILQSTTNTLRAVPNFGAPNDIPSVGDYDGDGKTDLAVTRANGTERVWFIQNSSNGQVRVVNWGAAAGDSINFFAVIDVDGDNKQDIMIARTVNNQRHFYVLRSSDNQPYFLAWGISTGVAATSDTSLYGDYDGDGKTDFVARRTVNGLYQWYIFESSTQQGRVVQFGQTGDLRGGEETENSIPTSSDQVEALEKF